MFVTRTLAAATLASAASCASAQCDWTFGAAFQVTGGEGGQEFALADVNNDGVIDIVDGISTYLNDGNGNFNYVPGVDLGAAAAQSVALGDMNNDGFIDAVVALQNSSLEGIRLAIFLGDGTGVFEVSQLNDLPDDLNTPLALRNDVELVDLNGDNRLDVIMTDKSRPLVRTFLNAGDGSLNEGGVQPPVDHAALANTEDIAVSDFDGDGHPDILVGHADQATEAAILWGGPGVTFSAPDPLPAGSILLPTIGDIDGDNDDDIIVGTASGAIRVLRNDGQRQFVPVDNIPIAGPVLGLTIDDFDGNGTADIIAHTFSSSGIIGFGVQGYRGDGAGTFSPGPFTQTTPDLYRNVETADLNGDLRPDLVLSVSTGQEGPEVLLNTSSGSFDPATFLQQPTSQIVAAGLSAQFATNAVSFGGLTVQYQWLRNGQPIADDATIIGTNTAVLTLLTTSPADIAEYQVVASVPACDGGTITTLSEPAVLAITGGAGPQTCPGDTNGDNVIDLADLNAVLAAFGQACP